MNSIGEQSEFQAVACHVCQHEVNDAAALSVEGQEYLYFFCGHDCYEQWQEGNSRAGE